MTLPTPGSGRGRGWFKSSFSQGETGCVEVNLDHPEVLVRDTKQDGAGPVLAVPADQWAAFLNDVRQGRELTGTSTVTVHRVELDVDYPGRAPITTTWHLHTDTSTPDVDAAAVLHFDDTEWAAFGHGVAAGEFAPTL